MRKRATLGASSSRTATTFIACGSLPPLSLPLSLAPTGSGAPTSAYPVALSALHRVSDSVTQSQLFIVAVSVSLDRERLFRTGGTGGGSRRSEDLLEQWQQRSERERRKAAGTARKKVAWEPGRVSWLRARGNSRGENRETLGPKVSLRSSGAELRVCNFDAYLPATLKLPREPVSSCFCYVPEDSAAGISSVPKVSELLDARCHLRRDEMPSEDRGTCLEMLAKRGYGSNETELAFPPPARRSGYETRLKNVRAGSRRYCG